MSQEGYLARLGIDTGDIDAAVNKTITYLSELGDAFDGLGKWADRATSSLMKTSGGAKQAADGVKAASDAVKQGSSAWQAYVKQLADANAAYQKFRQGQVTGEGGGTPTSSLNAGERKKLLDTAEAQSASLVSQLRLEEQQAADTAEMWRRLDLARAKDSSRDRMDHALQRESAGLAAAPQRYGGANPAEGRANLAAAQERMEMAKAEGAAQSYRAEVGRLSAAKERYNQVEAETRLALKAQTAAMNGNDLGQQVRATEAAALAQEQMNAAQREAASAQEQYNAGLSRTRYALYDVSQAMAAPGVAGVAVATAIAGSAVAYESEFANVRRTVGVTGEAADDLYDSMLRMTTTIPTSFADMAQIGTLAGQLGIAESRVASFTRTTAQFSATTDVTVDATATAFGRLDALLDDVQGQYDRLGSSILSVGINSVATESDIISIANQIAAASQQAGLAASEVIGLSSAMASLGIRPERARGTILRVFSEINMAVSEGGDALDAFASTSGMSADKFRQSWGTDFTTTFLGFLDGIRAKGEGAEMAIMDLGITASRDRDALLRLAQNGDVVADSLDLAAEGFENTSILADNFGIIAETNAAKIQILGNGLLAFFATLGKGTSGPLSDFLDRLIGVTQTLIRFADNPFVQTAGAIVAASAAIVGVLGIVGGLVLRGVGSWIALRQAIGTTTLTTWTAAGGFRALGASLLGAQGAAVGFFSALKVGLATTGIGLALVLVGEAIGFIAREMRTGAQVAEDYFGTIDGLSAAIAADNPELARRADALRETGTAASAAAGGLDEMIEAAAAQRVEMEQARAAIAAGNEALAAQEIALGENSAAWLRNQIMQSEAFRRMFENAEQMQSLMSGSFTARGVTVQTEGFSVDNLVTLSAEQGADAARDYVAGFKEELRQGFMDAGMDATEAVVAATLAADWSALEELAAGTAAAFDEAQLRASLGDITDGLLGVTDAGYEAEGGLGAATDGAWNASGAISQIINDAYGADNAARALSDSMYQLGAELANNGAAAAFSSDAMQQVIQNILTSSGSAQAAAANLQGFFNMLIESGYATAQQLAALQNVIASLTGGAAISVAIPKFNPAPFVAGLNSVRRAATGGGGGGRKRGGGGGGGGAAGAIRTLIDYANDLQKVMSRSFQIRFGGQKALDEITTSWREMREEAADARKVIREATDDINAALREHQATAKGLLSEKAVVQYWLSVAEAYGDALRAGELRSRLTEIDNELQKSASDSAKAQSDGAAKITDAQKSLDRGLTGNGEAAIENRGKLMDLVESYQDYIEELAASGMSQDELKKRTSDLKDQFIEQAVQLGYSRDELDRYTKGFDDVTVAINKVPRNITVEANVNPAIQALNEFAAKAEKRGSAAGGSYGRGFGSGVGRSLAGRSYSVTVTLQSPSLAAIDAWFNRIRNRIFNRARSDRILSIIAAGGNTGGGFRRGGWTGDGPANEIAGVVHGQEFVLNQKGAQAFPREMLEAANQGRTPQMPMVTMSTGGGGGMDARYLETMVGLLMEVRDAIGIEVSGDALQRAVNLTNEQSSRRGR